MDSRQQKTTVAGRVYEDFEPSMDWVREPAIDTQGLSTRHPKIVVTDNQPQEIIKPSTEAPKPPSQEAPKPPKPPHEKAQQAADPSKLKKQFSRKQPAPAETSEPLKPEKPTSEPEAKTGKADDGVGNGNIVSRQTIEKEKEMSKYEQKNTSNGMAADAGKQEKVDDFVQDKTDKNEVGKGIIRGSYYIFAKENFKQVFGDMVMEMKKSRNLKNCVLVVLFVVLGLAAFRYLRKSIN
ncbi:hypothetical protein GH714_012436 [Hevea brasiliensis]|uniref:Uncharacterized protein n=1 Tax=Hevea brasiliensis TaxID=3981 RepID=A0A6A6N9M8_HEVBR|nr:hypothetical protein GH714_012436 [Hevea brasiliensis]